MTQSFAVCPGEFGGQRLSEGLNALSGLHQGSCTDHAVVSQPHSAFGQAAGGDDAGAGKGLRPGVSECHPLEQCLCSTEKVQPGMALVFIDLSDATIM